ncbi:MAG TPA: RagB/SusD family nutrient uptake outer membrane protein [Saprospiraceae bacterium]|nr:RagB/SusD family nutrient uptake outer membrane protein [Saprospiraceae bacterium]
MNFSLKSNYWPSIGNINIKFSIKYFTIASFAITISCTGILDKEPLGILDAGSFFKTADDAIQALNAAYQPLLISNENKNFYWVFGTVASDDAITGGDGSRPGITAIDFFTHTPTNEEFNDFWKLNYGGIIQANTVVEKTPAIDADQELKDRIIGEALFLRAHYHFVLSQIFGPVPLITEIQAPDEVHVPRNSLEEIRAQIIEDCIRAASMLPVQYSGANVGRATKGAALALAAKTSLYQENWNEVLNYVSQIKALGVYSLVPEYLDNFRESTQNNSESVWEIQHANLELGVGNNLNQWWTSKKVPDGYGFAEVTADLVNTFEAGDPRLSFTIARNNDQYFGYVYKPSYSSTGFGVKKYLQSVAEVSQKSDGDINYTAIRYAEVLLWEAEANAELGRIAEAEIPLEVVRARARAQAADPVNTLPRVTGLDQAGMIEAVRHERRVELGFEMHRFFDLVRWGIAQDLLTGFQTGKHEFFPIPQTELDLNSMLTQNPGY